jgi:hypothetical protein
MTDSLYREEFAEKLADFIVDSYDRDSLERIVWDVTYEELNQMSWVDLVMLGEDYGLTPRTEGG